MEKFRKCAAVLRGDADDPSIQSPIFEMRKLSILVYKYTGIVKVRHWVTLSGSVLDILNCNSFFMLSLDTNVHCVSFFFCESADPQGSYIRASI